MVIPLKFDLTPEGKFVTGAEIGQDGYIDNVTYTLQMCYNHSFITIQYYGEDDTIIYDGDPRLLPYILKFQD